MMTGTARWTSRGSWLQARPLREHIGHTPVQVLAGGRGLHSSNSPHPEPFLVTEHQCKSPYSQLNMTRFYQHTVLRQKVLTPSRKVDACSPPKVLTLS